jgi:hypothetical protein
MAHHRDRYKRMPRPLAVTLRRRGAGR